MELRALAEPFFGEFGCKTVQFRATKRLWRPLPLSVPDGTINGALQLGFELRLKSRDTGGHFAACDGISRQFRTIMADALKSEKFACQCNHGP